jgi:hypothetical protein
MKIIASKAKLYRYWKILLIPVLGILFSVIAVRIVDPVKYPTNDFFVFWFAGHSVLTRQPYVAFIYPMPFSFLFVPLGLLSLYQAYIVWVVLSQFMILSSLALLLRLNPDPLRKQYILPLLAGLILYRPTIVSLFHGQESGLLLLVLVCTVYCWEKGKWWQGGLFLPILALKPNIGGLIVLLLSFYLILRRQIIALVAGGIFGLVLIVAGLVENPDWIIEFWRAGNTRLSQTFGFAPTIWGASTFFCNYRLNCSLAYGGSIGLLLLIGYLYLVARKFKVLSPIWVAGLAVTITLLLTPYSWPYDQLLLVVPIIAITMGLAKAGYRFLPTALIFLIIDMIAFILLDISTIIQMEIWNIAIPLSVLALLAWYLSSKNRLTSDVTRLSNHSMPAQTHPPSSPN